MPESKGLKRSILKNTATLQAILAATPECIILEQRKTIKLQIWLKEYVLTTHRCIINHFF